MIGEPKPDMGSPKTPESKHEENIIEGPSDDDMIEMYGLSHPDFHNRVAGLTSKKEAMSIKEEIEADEELTEEGRADLLNDLEIMWKI